MFSAHTYYIYVPVELSYMHLLKSHMSVCHADVEEQTHRGNSIIDSIAKKMLIELKIQTARSYVLSVSFCRKLSNIYIRVGIL